MVFIRSLEFLGDAVLDFLVTRHVFVAYNQQVTPGRVTDIRQDLSNNGRLAYISVACDLHKKLLHNCTDLFGQISRYAGDETLFPTNQSTEEYLSKVSTTFPMTGIRCLQSLSFFSRLGYRSMG